MTIRKVDIMKLDSFSTFDPRLVRLIFGANMGEHLTHKFKTHRNIFTWVSELDNANVNRFLAYINMPHHVEVVAMRHALRGFGIDHDQTLRGMVGAYRHEYIGFTLGKVFSQLKPFSAADESAWRYSISASGDMEISVGQLFERGVADYDLHPTDHKLFHHVFENVAAKLSVAPEADIYDRPISEFTHP